MFFQNSIGIDINEDQVSILHLRSSIKGYRIAGCEQVSFDLKEEWAKKCAHLKKQLNAFLDRQKLNAPDIYISIPNRHVVQRIVEFPVAAKENLATTIGYEIEKYVPLSVDKIYFDYQILFENKENNRLTVMLLVIKRDVLAPYIELAIELGKGAAGIEINAMASSNCYSYLTPDSKTEDFFYLSEKKTRIELGFITGGRLNYFRDFNYESFEDIAITIKNEMQRLKRQLQLDNSVYRMAVESENMKLNVNEDSFKENGFDCSVHLLPKGVLPSLEYAPAFGLALKGMEKVSTKINFLPKNDRKKPSKTGYYLMYSLMGLLLLGTVVYTGSYLLNHKMLMDRTDAELENLKKDVINVNELQSDIESLENRIKQLSDLKNEKILAVDILKELTERMPKNAWLKEFTLNENQVQIVGTAESASDIVTILEESILFYDAVFLSAITKDKEGNENFRIGIKVQTEEGR